MNNKQLLTVGATGAATVCTLKLLGSKFNRPDGIPVDNGVMQWDSRFEEVQPGYIHDIDGSPHRIGDASAMDAMYEMAAEYSLLATRCSRIVRQSLTETQIRALDTSFRNNGKFDLSVMTESQRVMTQTMVNAFVNFGQCLRVLADLFKAAGFERMYRPSVWENRGLDLANIVHRSILNPLVYRMGPLQYQPRVQRVTRPVGWKYVGWEIIQGFLNAYDVEIGGERYLIEDMERDGEELAESPGSVQQMGNVPATMGVAPLVPVVAAIVQKAIVIAIVGFTVYHVVRTVIEAASLFLGRNLAFGRAQADAYEEAMECARDPDRSPEERQICAQEAARIAQEVESYTPGAGTIVTLATMGGIGLIGYYVYNKFKKDK